MYSTKRLQTGDGINFANLPEGCSGKVESTNANHDTLQHLSKSMIPLSPNAMLTSKFGKWICEIYSVQTSPPCGPSGNVLPRLNFAKRGTRATDGPDISAAHPSAKICEIYSVNSPRTWLEWVYDGQLTLRCTNVNTALLKGHHVALARMESLSSRGGPVTTHYLRPLVWRGQGSKSHGLDGQKENAL